MPLARLLERAALFKARSAGAIVLCFHEIECRTFYQWITNLRTHYALVSLDSLVDKLHAGETVARHLAITFDDGWRTTCTEVAELCEEEQWPITIFVPTCVLQPSGSLWMAEWPHLVKRAAGKRLEAGGVVLDMTNPRASRESLDRLKTTLIGASGQDALTLVRVLLSEAGRGDDYVPVTSFVEESFVRQYSESDCVRFGSHTIDHQAFASQTEEGIRTQLKDSRQKLESLLPYKVRHFCYPYGDLANIGPLAPTLVPEYYESAFTMERGVVSQRSNRSLLPRVSLYEKDYPLRILAKLALAH